MFRFIRDALGRCEPHTPGMLFTYGDGFYGLYAAAKSRAPFDLFIAKHSKFEVPHALDHSRLMTRLLKLDGRVTISEAEPSLNNGPYGLGICVSVLTNLKDPRPMLDMLRRIVSGPLVLQTPVSPTHLEPEYFFAELTWRSWGCRFSHEWLIRAVVEAGWTVVNESVGLLPGSDARDGASSYLLCV